MKNIKNVYVGLSADILHEGHINILKIASQYGNVIVVNDGSSDSTLECVQSTSAIIISHKKNLGYEASLSSGINFAINKNYKCRNCKSTKIFKLINFNKVPLANNLVLLFRYYLVLNHRT